ncbi:MAG: glycosyltransferase family 4 protein [Hyphomicrobiaceae bacterium]|nr:glycosyltransferase family 4 protein [Hyphomicrobiaceae bacterium]
MLPDYGVEASVIRLPGSFPEPTAADLDEAVRLLAAAPPDAALMVDGLALGAIPADRLDAVKAPLIALVHHPLCLEAGLSADRAAALKQSETAVLARARQVVVTSSSMKRILVEDFGVPMPKVTVAEPGTDPAARATGTGTPFQILSVGAVSPRKGYHVLIDALAPLTEHDWRATICGATDRDPKTVAKLEAQIEAAGLSERVRLAGTVVPATLQRFYDTADLFVLPSLFEGYGMVLAEAMARGLPIVTTTGGAAAETVPDAAALKVAPGDAAALSSAIDKTLRDKRLRARLADASWDTGRTLPPWTETTRRIAAVVMGLQL